MFSISQTERQREEDIFLPDTHCRLAIYGSSDEFISPDIGSAPTSNWRDLLLICTKRQNLLEGVEEKNTNRMGISIREESWCEDWGKCKKKKKGKRMSENEKKKGEIQTTGRKRC